MYPFWTILAAVLLPYIWATVAVFVPGSGVGSNGYFDYTHLAAFARIKFAKFSPTMMANGQEFATPWTVEENPQTVNGGNREGAFANIDKIGSWHDNGTKGGYTSIDPFQVTF